MQLVIVFISIALHTSPGDFIEFDVTFLFQVPDEYKLLLISLLKVGGEDDVKYCDRLERVIVDVAKEAIQSISDVSC